MLELVDGRTELWQWDTSRKIKVEPNCDQLHFSNKLLGRSLDVDVVDGVATIPDVLLQTDKDITVWGYVGSADEGYTKFSKTFKVNKRNKPADYVYTPTEIYTIDQAVEKALQEAKDSGEFDGKDGKDGKDGLDGKDGYTPQKGVDYFDGKDGQNGKDGADGYTPQYGIDYATPEEKDKLTEEILTATEDEWIDLADITLEEDVSLIYIDQDINGQPFSVRKIFARIVAPSVLSGSIGANVINSAYGDCAYEDNVSPQRVYIYYELVKGKFAIIQFSYNKHVDYFNSDLGSSSRVIRITNRESFSAFRLGLVNSLPAGTTIQVWGLKA